MTKSARLIIISLLAMVSACSVSGDADQVSVRHSSEQRIVGELAAERHCAKFDKLPRLLKISPTVAEASTLYFRTKTSVYECIDGTSE